MFILTAFHKNIPIKLFSLNKARGLEDSERIEMFPTLETKDQAKEFLTNKVWLSKDVNVYIIEIGKIWG